MTQPSPFLCIFPGQGAQYVGMGQDFAQHFSIARETYEEAEDVLGESLTPVIFDGPLDTLTQTRNSQLAIFVTSFAIYRTLKSQHPSFAPQAVAGLSLGEYTALVVSGVLSFTQALDLVRIRGTLMQKACEEKRGTMAAIIGLEADKVFEQIESLASSFSVYVANVNSPNQTVISGSCQGVEFASKYLKDSGAKKVVPLHVAGAFHSPMMKSAQIGLEIALKTHTLSDPSVPIVLNVTGEMAKSASQIKQALALQIVSPVLWHQSIERLDTLYPTAHMFIEFGPGKTLAGLNRRIGPNKDTYSVTSVQDLDQLFAQGSL